METAVSFFRTWNNHKQAALSIGLGLVMLLVIYAADASISIDDIVMDMAVAGQAPSVAHIFGVDWIGRDMFLRTMKGLGGSLRVGLITSVITLILATFLAIVSAATFRKLDQLVGILIDTFLGVPHFVILVLISASLGGGELGVIVAVATTHWPPLTRILRAEILQLREEQYIRTAEQFGKSDWFIARAHILRHLLPQIFVRFVLVFPHVILHEAGLTFLGFGLSPLQPAIGVILSESVQYISTGMWWLILFPGLALLLMVMCFEQIGESLNKILNPETSRR